MAVLQFTTEVTRIRFADASTTRGTDGRTTKGTPFDTPVKVSFQPLTGRDLDTLPEGERHADWRKVYAPAGSFRTASQHAADAGALADQIETVLDGVTVRYEVRQVRPYRYLLSHQRILAVRIQEVA